MTIKAIDETRIRRFLEPWIDKKGKKNPTLSDPYVKSILLRAAKVDTDQSKLYDQLDTFFSIAHANTKHFVHKFKRQIEKIREKDLSEFQRDNRNQNKQPEHNKHNNTHNRPALFNKNPQRPQPPKIPYQKPQIPQIPKQTHLPTTSVPKKNAPGFFLSSAAISLRDSDQNFEKLRLNEKGEQIDEKGNVIKIERTNKTEKMQKVPIDRKIPTAVRPTNREFKFIPQGSITKAIEEKREEIRTDIAVASGLPIYDVIAMRRNYEIPTVDWWDAPFVDETTWEPAFLEIDNSFQNSAPMPVKKLESRAVPTMLTPDELKRDRHIRKLEKANQERLMIRLNLKEPEPSRVKPQTMINYNSGEAFLKPTEVENRQKMAQEKRIKEHLERNEENKLTPEERKMKKQSKMMEDADKNTIDLCYSVKSLNHPLHLSTILKMGQKLFLSGGIFVVKYPERYFVVAECGEKGFRKFKSLMENRINWNLEHESIPKEISASNKCVLAYESMPMPHQRNFGNFRKYVFDALTQCQKFFEKNNASHLFDPVNAASFD
ncbi:hypothetical protein TVAG_033440 [Trichomonas vaginalis G3]|uniref:Uncharacterized protein n=2 Tax=Trichomonas vaginalis (strain ATCC PRA-98 / G3) TaxID=412133 RepID=A2FJ09_TRIV3|nr:hypothetical protein TVAG_033440 [Trichomonas vaginalis G3]|eukprot:XP_001308054.1 hypothetical protein [Trichomonas vaginalis G3]